VLLRIEEARIVFVWVLFALAWAIRLFNSEINFPTLTFSLVGVEIFVESIDESFESDVSSVGEGRIFCSLFKFDIGNDFVFLDWSIGDETITTDGGWGGGAPGRSNWVPPLGVRRWALSIGLKLDELAAK
jgi:hypothetical protein